MSQIQSDALIPMQSRKISLTALIVLMDGFYTGERAAQIVRGYTELRFKEGVNPLKKSDALYAAVDLTPRTYNVSIRSRYYLPLETTITIPDPSTRIAAGDLLRIPVLLEPAPAYPFPEGTTLLRGRVCDAASGLPLGGASLSITDGGDQPLEGSADAFGLFAFYFDAIRVGKVVRVEASAQGYRPCEVELSLRPEQTTMTSLSLTKEPEPSAQPHSAVEIEENEQE